MLCKICNKEFSNNFITKHIKKEHGLLPEVYYKQYIDSSSGACRYCGSNTKFISITLGYAVYCSRKCSNSSTEVKEEKKKTYITRYGVEHISQLDAVKNMKAKKSLEKYGTYTPLQNEDIKDKIKSTCLDRYGVECAAASAIVTEKRKETSVKRYGVDNPSKHPDIQHRIKQTLVNRYGVSTISDIEGIREKIENTNIKKYGYKNPMQNKDIYKKYINSINRKYNVDHVSQSEYYKKKLSEKSLRRFVEVLKKGDRLKGLVTPNFNLDNYSGANKYYEWVCNTCGKIFEDKLEFNRIPRCLTCFPYISSGQSTQELELLEFVKSICDDVIIHHDKEVLSGKELDIYIPDKQLAIEYNGLYWHREGITDNPNSHIDKTNLCFEKSIILLHVFEDEWMNKRDIVASVIKNKLGVSSQKIDARKCVVEENIDKEKASEFLENNHLQGNSFGENIGLLYNGELISLLVYGKPRFSRKYDVEIYRFCAKKDLVVRGGLSRLVSRLKSKYTSIITYADLRWGIGEAYSKCGFILSGRTKPSYSYYSLKTRSSRINRLNFQKHLLQEKLDIFDPSLTEWENMQMNGYDRVWDCGNFKYIWHQKDKS